MAPPLDRPRAADRLAAPQASSSDRHCHPPRPLAPILGVEASASSLKLKGPRASPLLGPFATPVAGNLRAGRALLLVSPKTVPFGVPKTRDRLAVKAHGACITGT